MSHLVLVMGVSGAGKSTVGPLIAHRLGLRFDDADAFHPPANVAKMSRGAPLDDTDRAPWLDAIGAHLAAHEGVGCVVTCSALKRAYRDRLRVAAPGLRLVFLQGDLALVAARQAARQGHFMPASLVASQFATLEPPAPEEGAILLDVAATPDALAEAAISALRQ
ncbi:gluconokinase [Roseomonas frigidaquae]|uniref:Gluconokinase n=1 Tax=Falsiroseomonas frigidaquae TaxID=487318 RepID=A0ABX1F0B0_9PROT|nr:gluconokinase [Falsiroseomonas frigidaquae]NKE45770.1 gluconokinase [Falsiroseomonas frigidaquae]